MGLDITAYSDLTLDLTAEMDADGYPVDWNNFVMVWDLTEQEKLFPGRAGNLRQGIHSFSDNYGFRAGSYSGYGSWRSWLAQLAGFKDAADYWNRATPEAPFYELINFSDCEGFIGHEAAAELAKDFGAHDGGGGWTGEKYLKWKEACEVAARNGAIQFH